MTRSFDWAIGFTRPKPLVPKFKFLLGLRPLIFENVEPRARKCSLRPYLGAPEHREREGQTKWITF